MFTFKNLLISFTESLTFGGHQVQHQGQGKDVVRVAWSCSGSLYSRNF